MTKQQVIQLRDQMILNVENLNRFLLQCDDQINVLGVVDGGGYSDDQIWESINVTIDKDYIVDDPETFNEMNEEEKHCALNSLIVNIEYTSKED